MAVNKRDRMREWLPKSQQMRRRYLSEREYRNIRALVASGETMADVARQFGFNYSTITSVVYQTKKPRRRT